MTDPIAQAEIDRLLWRHNLVLELGSKMTVFEKGGIVEIFECLFCDSTGTQYDARRMEHIRCRKCGGAGYHKRKAP